MINAAGTRARALGGPCRAWVVAAPSALGRSKTRPACNLLYPWSMLLTYIHAGTLLTRDSA